MAQATDSLVALRRSIHANALPILSTTSDAANPAPTTDLGAASHLITADPPTSYDLDSETRFISNDKPFNLRSIYFAWINKDTPITEYITLAQELNDTLSKSKPESSLVRNLVFVERLDLITWLEGTSEGSDFIKGSGAPAEQVKADAATEGAAQAARQTRQIDPALQRIFNNERKMGDRNSVLRGIKPTDFSHVRKSAEVFLSRHRAKNAPPNTANGRPQAATPSVPQTIATHPKKPARRPDPIILLSPSASSLLRLGNVKSFLENGIYHPPDSSSMAVSTAASMIQMSRLLPSIDSTRPVRFYLVDTTENFKPDYWSRVVAVFTTGQAWQFKSYKWQNPLELFANVLGVYVGWRGEALPDSVKSWGRGVMPVGIDKWTPQQGERGRYRDREVVEQIWGNIEATMRRKGWSREQTGR